jgi:hypothetical protein
MLTSPAADQLETSPVSLWNEKQDAQGLAHLPETA